VSAPPPDTALFARSEQSEIFALFPVEYVQVVAVDHPEIVGEGIDGASRTIVPVSSSPGGASKVRAKRPAAST
jgi:hypothetical protein